MFTDAHRKPTLIALTLIVILGIVASACAAPTPQVVEKLVEKEKVVQQTVVVEKEKVVEKPVIQTQVVEKSVVVTATPAPAAAGQRYGRRPDVALRDPRLRPHGPGFGRRLRPVHHRLPLHAVVRA